MINAMTYEEFINRKMPVAELDGFEPVSEPHPSLKPHQRDIAAWSAHGGRRAIFAAFGLGKTRMHLQVAKWIVEREQKPYLIIAPLGVRQEFTRVDGPAMGMELEYCRTDAEIAEAKTPFIITNYERVRDGAITIDGRFCGAGLDEASVLRSFGSLTYQRFLTLFKAIRYRFVFTATPSPNRYKELIHYAGFLGVMDTGEALTRFFKRDPKKANNLSIYPHMEERFWLWVSTWAVFMQRPSDLGYPDDGYDLPPMKVHWHCVSVDHKKAWKQLDSWGQRQLILDQSSGLKEIAEVKRETMVNRLSKAREIMGIVPNCYWREVLDGNDAARAIFERHYSRRKYKDGRDPKLFTGPGEKCVLLSHDQTALFIWRKFIDDSGQCGVNCAVFRNEGKALSSDLILEAERIAANRWPGERAYTYVNTKKVKSSNPGCCFKAAGWTKCGKTKGGLLVLEKTLFGSAPLSTKHWLLWHDLEAERRLIELSIPGVRTVYGSQDLEEREEIILGFSRGEFPILATKPILAGSGCNFQKHCADAIFLGSTYKFNDFIQAAHRVHRFLQEKEVNIHVIYSESEEPVIRTLKEKWAKHDELVARMAGILRKFKLTLNPMHLTRSNTCTRSEVTGDVFRAILNDNVAELSTWPENCVDQIVTSIPFGNQYEYSPSVLDFGHNPNNDAFFEQMDFLVPHLLRVLRPGRVCCLHVKDRIRFGNVTGLGMPTVDPFSDQTTDCFLKHGFAYMGRITIDTDVVRENNQTYRLGWTENSKDSSKMGVGMPEYVLLFRKLPSDLSDAYADVPVTKDKAKYTRADWQIDAASLWRSNGNRLPDPDLMVHLPMDTIGRIWREHCGKKGYNYQEHVDMGRALEKLGKLPASFMLFPPVSLHPDVWTDIARMRVLNSEQGKRNQENHVCPLQLDIVERLIRRYSNPGDIVFDPFAGIFTVPYQAIHMGRQGWGVELSEEYWRCGVGYCEQAESEHNAPTLFDLQEQGMEAIAQ